MVSDQFRKLVARCPQHNAIAKQACNS